MSVRQGNSNSVPCPKCGSAAVIKAPYAAYRDRFFLVCRPYVCQQCRWVFVGPCSVTLCLTGMAIGVLFILAAAGSGGSSALSGLRALLGSGDWRQLPSVFWNGVATVGCACMGMWIVYISVGTAIISLRGRRRVQAGESEISEK